MNETQKRSKNPKHWRQLNIKCAPEFNSLLESVHGIRQEGIAETVRTFYVDEAIRQVAFGLRSGVITMADVDDFFKRGSDGRWTGVYCGLQLLLAAILEKEPDFRKHYHIWLLKLDDQIPFHEIQSSVDEIVRRWAPVGRPG